LEEHGEVSALFQTKNGLLSAGVLDPVNEVIARILPS
jgi:hypothetical protein